MVEKNQKKSRLLTAGGIGLAVVILIIILLLTRCGGFTASVSPSQLAQLLAEEGVQTIEVNSDIYVDEPLAVNGDKTIVGDGRIILNTALEGEWPNTDQPTWGMGCAAQNPEDGTKMPAVLNVSSGATLNLSGSVIVDAQGNGNGVLLNGKAKMKISDNAGIQNGRYANLVIGEQADVLMEGGQLLDGSTYNILNYGKLRLAEGTVSGAKAGSVVYTTGSFTQQGGTVSGANFHNVYVAGGDFIMTGGLNEKAAKDGILVAKGGNAEVTGGSITTCIHGLCNNGTTTVGDITLNECGIMNYADGTLDLKGTTVDTSEVYCLSNNGGTVNAEDFTAIGCDTCAIYNFSGDMNLVNVNVNGSRDGNVANAGGNLTIDGGTLDVCRDKSLVVGNGKAVVSNVTFKGTTSEKYGIYAYGGETYINDCAIENVSSTAVKLDAGSYVELNNVSIKDVEQNAFQNDGGKLVANDVTVENTNSHGIYNNGGEIIVDGLELTGVKKNAIQHKAGTTSVSGMDASDIGNHGAYVAEGELTVEMSSFDDMAGNGFYIIEGDNKLVLKGVIISNAVQQGINNSSKVEGSNVTISNTGKNGIYNKTGGSVSVAGLKISNVAEHGINNKANLSASYVTVVNTGEGSNGIQNNGTMALSGASVTNSKNHGIYNGGTLTAYDIKVNGTKENGVYNDKGEAVITGLTIADAGAQGVNNNSVIELEDVKITKTGKNGIYNKTGGNMSVKGLGVDGTGEHGVSNDDTMKLSNAAITNTGDTKNGIQNAGVLTVNGVKISNSQNHGVYNSGTIIGAGLTATNVAGNGVYNIDNAVVEIAGITVSEAKDQGINNNGDLTASNVNISGTGKNGVFNNGGNAVINGLTVSGAGEHGVSNNPAENGSGVDAVMTLSNATINGSGAVKTDSNCIQNKGTLTLENVTLSKSSNHGIYNDGTITSKGALTISDSAVNGVYNYGGTVDIASLTVNRTLGGNADSHGVNNTGVMTIGAATISNAFANGIQNSSGTITVSNATIKESGKHGIYNGNVFNGKSIGVTGAGDLLASNAGDMVIDGLTLTGSAKKALYNTGYAELYDATINGAAVTNGGSAEYLVDNNGGILDLTDATLVDANGTALHNRGSAFSAVTNVIIDGAGNYGIFVEGGSTLSGDGLVVNNVTKKITGAEGYAIKNAGMITMMDHVTLGDYDDDVTGDGRTARKATSGIASTAFTNDAATASYSGYDLTIKNAPNGNAVYNKGKMYVTDLYVENVKDGVVNRYNSWATLTGDVTLKNVIRNPVSLYGPESGSYVNGITVTPGSVITIDTCGSHAINNKGSFLADGTTLTIKNVTGQNVNAINNHTSGTMTLGDVAIDGVYVTVSVNKDTNKINTNSGNGIQSNGAMTLNGTATISNIFTKPENGSTDNSNSTGVVVKNGGKITGSGSIILIGNQTAPEGYEGYTGMFNGILLDNGTLDITGDVSVSNVINQGIYAANETKGGTIKANNITVSGVKNGNGIYIRYKTCTLDATGSVLVSATGQNAICNAGKFNVAEDVVIENITSGYNGLRNDGSGNMTIGGDVVISNISGTTTAGGRGNALTSNGKVTVGGNVTISGVTTSGNTDNTSNNAINGSGTITVGGNVTVTDKIAAGHGAFLDQGRLYVTGNIEINGTGTGKQGIYGANETKDDAGKVTKTAEITAANITIKNAGGNGIYTNKTSNKLTVTGAIHISGSAAGHGLSTSGITSAGSLTITDTTMSDKNGIEVKSGSLTVTGPITVTNSGKRGLNNAGTVTADSLTIDGFGENGIQNGGTLKVSGAISIANGTGTGHGIYNSKTLEAGSFSVSNVTRNGINNGGSMKITGNVSISNAVQGGIGNSKTFSAGGVIIDTVTAGPGINNSGTFTVSGATNVMNITGTNVNAIQNKNVMTLNDVVVDGVYITAGNDKTFVGNGLYNEKTLTLNGTASITNVFASRKDNSIAAGFAQASTGTTAGTGGLVITGTEATNETCPYGINNGIFLDASTINLSGDITVSNALNQGIYVANENAALTAHNISVSDITGNGIYVNKATGSLTATGAISVVNAGQHGINNAGAVTAGSISVQTAGKAGNHNGINNNGGTVNVTGTIAVSETGGHGISNNNVLNAGSVSVTNVTGSGNGIQNSGNGVLTVTGEVVVNNVAAGHGIYNGKTVSFGSYTVSNAKKNGVNNGGTMTVNGAITVSKTGVDGVSNSGTLTAGSINVADLSGTNGSAVKNTGTMNAGGISIRDIKMTITADDYGNALFNKGTLNLTGNVSINGVTTSSNTNDYKCNGIYNVGGTITSAAEITITVENIQRSGVYMNGGSITGSQITLVVKNTEKTLIRLLNGATIDVLAVIADTGKDQGIQLDDANTLKAQVVMVSNVPQNGLRLKNASAEPTVQIDALICTDCGNHALASNNNIVSDNVTIGKVYHSNCTNVLHGKIQTGVVGETVDLTTLSAEESAALTAQLPESVVNVLFPSTTTEEESSSESNTDGTDTSTDGTDTSTDGTNTSTDGTNTSTDGTDTSTDGTDTSTDSADTNTDGTNTNTDSTDTNTDNTDTSTDSTDTNTDNTDTSTDSTDTNTDGTDTNTESTGTDTEGTDTNTETSAGEDNTSPDQGETTEGQEAA